MLLSDRHVAFRSVPAPRPRESRGSGLVIALGVLAMLAIMATTFITLMRLNARLSRAFNDDLQVEMLCQGVANYVVGVLRENQDRSMMQNADGSLGVKYANRVGIMGGRGWWEGIGSYNPSGTTWITDFGLNIPGRNTDYWAAARVGGTDTRQVNKSTTTADGAMGDHAYGTGPAHDVWYSSSTDGYWESGLYSNSSWYEYNQASFGGSSMDIVIVNRQDRVIANALNPAPLGTGKESYFAMVYGHMNGISDLSATQCPYALYNYTDGGGKSWPIWEPTEPSYGYGATSDNPVPHWYRTDACNSEMNFLGNYCYDSMTFLTHGLTSHIHPGAKLTQAWEGPGLNNTSGMMRLPGGLFWRWSVKIGVPEERYTNLNMVGNCELQVGAGRLGNMDRRGLQAYNGDSTCRTNHLGMISWKGYPGDSTFGLFSNRYDAVCFSPYQIDPYRLLGMDAYDFTTNVETDGDKLLDPSIFPVSTFCDDWIAQRWGNGRIPSDTGSGGIYASDQFRPGWRRDGASYYKIPSPDNPQGNDWYYGAAEALNHQDEDIIPQSSRVFSVLYNRLGNNLSSSRFAFDRMRAYVSTFGADTILRGKLWPQEGPPYTSNQGNFRDMRILRKINLNMLGARSYPSWAPAGDVLVGRNGSIQNYSDNPTKGGAACTNWYNRAAAERDRLYYMLKAMLTFTGTTWSPPGVTNYNATPNWLACQFVASLTDMVSWDQCETLYVAPDGSPAWALGMKKFPVINEVAFYSNGNANTANYNLFRFSVELYNPAENIPWVADADEAFDISQYVLQVGTHYFRLGTLHKFNSVTWTDMGLIDQSPNNMIGADGLYGVPVPGWYFGGTVNPDPSWSRFVHVTWYDLAQPNPQFPPGVTYTELQGGDSSNPQAFTGVTIALWKPLPPSFPTSATIPDTNFIKTDPLGAGSGRYMMVDTTDDPTTGKIKLIRPWYPGAAPGRNENGPADIKADPDFSPALTRNKTNYCGLYHRWDPMNANVYVDPSLPKTKYGKGDKGTVQWCPGWSIARASTMGRPNTEYWPNMYSTDDPGTIGAPGAGASLGTYKRCFETDFKVPSCDLPSVGWLGEIILWNCAQDGPITLVYNQGQRPDASNGNGPRNTYFANRLENAKLDLFAPWGKPHNLHLYDMFTVQDPMHNGYDDDGDGAVDEDDTGSQSGDLLGPEVRVYGCIDVNHVGVKTVSNLFPGNHVPDMYRMVNTGHPYDRGSSGTAGDWTSTGPLESIGDMLRLDDLRGWPGGDMGAFSSWNCGDYSKYKGSYNLTGSGDIWGHGTGWGTTATYDLDTNGIVDERDERDFWFTQSANYMTTRSNVFTAEVATQVTDPPTYPGANYLRGAYKIGSTGRVYAEKHLVMLVDRTTTLRFKFVGGVPGPCDFTGPCRVLARRWGHDRK